MTLNSDTIIHEIRQELTELIDDITDDAAQQATADESERGLFFWLLRLGAQLNVTGDLDARFLNVSLSTRARDFSLRRTALRLIPRALRLVHQVEFHHGSTSISRYRLRTELVTFEQGRRGCVGGFKGQCRFALRCAAPHWQRRLGLLAAFAPFAGLGWRTSIDEIELGSR